MRELPILHIAKDSVSWLTCGQQPKLLCRELLGGVPFTAQDAVALLKTGKARRGPCILAVDASYYNRRQIELPAGLEGRELKNVLTRKASNLAGPGKKAVFQALPLAGSRKNQREGIQSWLVFAMDYDKLRDLTEELRRAGFKAKRVVASELAYHGNLSIPRLGESDALIQIGQLEGGLGVSLISRDGLVTQNVAPTGLLDREETASTLVQELRSMDSYWRQLSEGGSVTHAHFSCFSKDWVDQISPAAQMVLPNVEIDFEGDLEAMCDEEHTHAPVLATCRSQGPLSIDFTLATPPHKLVVGILAAASVACVVTLGNLGREQFTGLTGRIDSGIGMRQNHGQVQDLSAILQAELDSMEAIESDFQDEWSAFMGTGTSSLPYAQVCSEVLRAFGDDAALEALNMTGGEGALGYQIIGVVPAGTAVAGRALGVIRSRLSEVPAFGVIQIEPDTRVPNFDGGPSLLRFTISGFWDPRVAIGVLEGEQR